MNKICVYTCITGDYDNLIDIKKENGIDYICYTNNKLIKSDTWSVKYINDLELSNVKLARKIKILGTPDLEKYDIVLWIDGNTTPKSSIIDFLNKYSDLDNYDLISYKHHERSTTFEELEKCYECKKENLDNINQLINKYKEEKFKDVIPLIESGMIIRNFKNKVLNKAMNLWFDMIDKYSHRDQLSFGYVVFKTGIKVKLLDINQYDNEYFDVTNHVSESKKINVEYIIDSRNSFNISNIKTDVLKIVNNKITIKVPSNHQMKLYLKLNDNQVGIVKKTNKCDFYNVSTTVDGDIIINTLSFAILSKDIELSIHVYNSTSIYLDEMNRLNNKLRDCYNTINDTQKNNIQLNNEYIKLKQEYDMLFSKYNSSIINKIKDKINK